MRKISHFVLALCLLSLPAGARPNFAALAGLNFADYRLISPGNKERINLVPSFRGGCFGDFLLHGAAYLQPGIAYVRSSFEYGGPDFKSAATINSVELSLNFSLKLRSQVIIGAGPYLTRNVSGDYTHTYNGYTTSRPLLSNSNASADMIKRTDLGFTAYVGYQFRNGLFIKSQMTRGLVNLDPLDRNRYAITNFTFGITGGYFLFNKTKAQRQKKAAGRARKDEGVEKNTGKHRRPEND